MTQILSEIFLDYSDVLIKPKMGDNLDSRANVELAREFRFKHGATRTGLGIFNANMFTIGNFDTAKMLLKNNMFATLHKFYTADEIKKFMSDCPNSDNLFITIGLRDFDAELKKLELVGAKNICIDAPNFYIPKALDCLKKVREKFPNSVIMVGNVASSDICQKLLDYADIIKTGIGPGSACTTRKITGCGVPMVSMILECADVIHAVDGHLCADGGIVNIGDISKAFCLNSDFVMIGGMFAGTDCAAGDIIEREGKKFKEFFGMSSEKANNELMGGMKNYKAPEGREVLIPYTGELQTVLNHICGGIASACTYIGAISVKQMSKCGTLIRVNNQYNKVFGN